MSEDAQPIAGLELPVTAALDVKNYAPAKWVGLWVSKDSQEFFKEFWKTTCPCGVVATYPINGFPTVTTKHPCDDPTHWTVQVDQPLT